MTTTKELFIQEYTPKRQKFDEEDKENITTTKDVSEVAWIDKNDEDMIQEMNNGR